MEQLLTRQQGEIVTLERRLVLAVRDALARTEAPADDVQRLARLLDEMDELFLLVIVGEYNTGKSTFINALLGDEVFAMGDLPTTRAISILRHGAAGPPELVSEHVQAYRYPLDVLRDLEIVDTPGTNSIDRMEEAITREFVPRADLVLFVTSLLQPLTASELDFLGHIREWGKKVVFVVNGVDRRNSDDQVARVREYLSREVSARMGGDPPAVYLVSALRALRRKMATRGGATPDAPDPLDEYPALERYLLETLRDTERVRLKLLSPLGVVRHLLDTNGATLDSRLSVVREDSRVLVSIREQLDAYATELRTDSERYLLEVQSVLGDVERRGRVWLERTIRIGNFNLLRNRDAVENRFRNEVVADAPRDIEAVVHRMVDWTVRRNLKLWTTIFAALDAHTARLRASGVFDPEARSDFHYNREELFSNLRAPVEQRLQEFNVDREAQRIVDSVREAVTSALGVNVLAIGLGAIFLAVFTTAALDVTGILTATLAAVAGWLIIPARRKQLVHDLETNIEKLSADLTALLRANFETQRAAYERQLLDVVEPYERFLSAERGRVEQGIAELASAETDRAAIERRIAEAFPEPVAAAR